MSKIYEKSQNIEVVDENGFTNNLPKNMHKPKISKQSANKIMGYGNHLLDDDDYEDDDWYISDKPAPRILKPMPKEAQELFGMLSVMRPAGTIFETCYIEKYILSLPGAEMDNFGNIIVVTDPLSSVLWSCHTDTVHNIDSPRNGDEFIPNGYHSIKYENGLIRLDHEKNRLNNFYSNCLGGDDGVGCWLMRNMILKNVPGTYIFHREEEIGGFGSRYVANTESYNLTKNFDYAIAFDRRGTNEIITHQGGSRTCSDRFAESLAEQLSYSGNTYRKSTGGTFTDTKNYNSLIKECTNVSCGYNSEHGPTETVNLYHAMILMDKLINFDESKLYKSYGYNEVDYFEEKTSYHDLDPSSYFDNVIEIEHMARTYPEEVARIIINETNLSSEDVRKMIVEQLGIL